MVPLSIRSLLASWNTGSVDEHFMVRLAANLLWSVFIRDNSTGNRTGFSFMLCAQFVLAIESVVSSDDQSVCALH